MRTKPALYSILSGCAWAIVACLVAYSVAPIRSGAAEIGRSFIGGVLAAPVIGLLIGVISRKFMSLGQPGRLAVALADLYVAAWLFLLAAGIARWFMEFSGSLQPLAFRALVVDPVMGAVLGLTYTGYVLLLWPLSYANHLLVARAWNATNAI